MCTVSIVTGPTPLIDEAVARRKATRWLVETVGNLLTADEGAWSKKLGGLSGGLEPM